MTRLLTVGHGTAAEAELGGRLRTAAVTSLVDVRIAPGSRRSPHVSRMALTEWLPAYGVGYRWERRLGGFRRLPPDSPDTALRNDSFRAYAAHMRTSDFCTAVEVLLAQATVEQVAVMCSESVWWRCHRRLLADFVTLVHGLDVGHLLPDGRIAGHPVTVGARRTETGLLIYDGSA